MGALLQHVERLAAPRDRVQVEACLIEALHDLLAGDHTCFYKQFAADREPLIGLAVEHGAQGLSVFDDGLSWPPDTVSIHRRPLIDRCHTLGQTHRAREGSTWHQVIPIPGNGPGNPENFITLARPQALSDEEMTVADGLIRIYRNYTALLDYSESDTLTGLLNRKTFDEFLFRILSSLRLHDDDALGTEVLPHRRHPDKNAGDHWLAVMDLDRFKRINDNFGHMIGDEVLLMTANRMRDNFRSLDKLFRFGGEEFVVVLKPTSAVNAQRVFDRFRLAIAEQSFPQVGQVTISIGVARIRANDTASIILDNADRALYWAKENGRNQVACYEHLVETGILAPSAELSSEIDLF